MSEQTWVPLAQQLRDEAFEVMRAMEVLGQTSGCFGDMKDYYRTKSRVDAYTSGLLRAATCVQAEAPDEGADPGGH